jgi:membrane-bound lytic murein transglycosylase D
MRDEIAEQFLARYQNGMAAFAQLGEKVRLRSAIEQRIYDVYSRDPANLATLLEGRARIRVQRGLADEFAAAANRAAPLIPVVEQIFIDHGVPSMISRVAFVESMFNPKAYSKVGASGLWQFMPETARRFMLVNQWVDERHAPLKATRAAARLFRENHQELGSWPLAITAYNHGPLGIKKAIQKVGSRDIQTVISRYESPSFGFASRNFYAEFLAAHRTFEHLRRSGSLHWSPTFPDLPEVDTIHLPAPTSVAQIVAHTGLSHDQVARLNPCLRSPLFTTHRHHPLPKGYELILPKSVGKRLVLGLAPRPLKSTTGRL